MSANKEASDMAQRTAHDLAAAKLRLTNIPGTARVRIGDGPGMSLTLSGPDKLLADIKWEVRDGTLHVEGPKFGGGGTMMINSFGPGGSMSVIRGGRGGMVISGGGIVVSGRQTVITTGGGQVIVDGKVISPGGDGETGAVELTVHVQQGMPVGISDDGAGVYELDSIRGTLDVKLGAGGSVSAGEMDAARIAIRGSGDVEIASVRRGLRADIAGSGDVRVRGGQVSQLQVSIAGSGDVAFGGTAQDADLSVAGSGDIRVDTVTGSLRKNVSGSGDIDVRVQPARSADDFWD